MDLIVYVGLGFLSIASVIMLSFFLVGMDSVKNGEELATKFHRAARGEEMNARSRIFFVFRFWPIDSRNNQVLPYITGKFRRLPFMLTVIDFCLIGHYKKTDKKKFLLMAFGNGLGFILMMGGVALMAYGLVNDNVLFMTNSIFVILAGIFVGIYSSKLLVRDGIPIIAKMDISERDKKWLVRIIKLSFVIRIVAMIIDIAKMALEASKRTDN